MLVMPGGIDPCTHFHFELMDREVIEDFYTGTKAAVAGGTTMIMDYVVPEKQERLVDAYKRVRDLADANVVCDYGLHMCITWFSKSVANEMKLISEKCGINSFKMYMGLSDKLMLNDGIIFNIFIECSKLGALPMVHAENSYIVEENAKTLMKKGINGLKAHYLARTVQTEGEAIFRACTIANIVQSPLYICNVMSTHGVEEMIVKQQKSNIPIYGEVVTAALGSQGAPEDLTLARKFAFVRSPPIRQDATNQENLMHHLSQGALAVTASDDCSFLLNDKFTEKFDFQNIPCGTNGVEDRMSIIWHNGVNKGILTPCQFVAVTSTNTAKIFNLYPKKGVIAIGSDADIVVWNPSKIRTISHYTHQQRCDYNIFSGTTVFGGPEVVIVRGQVCSHKGLLMVEKGMGKFVKTKSCCKYLYRQNKVDTE